jgi:hypothetical protein
MGVKVKGIAELAYKLENMMETSIRGASDILEAGADDIQKLAREMAPVDEGNLEQAIMVEKKRDGINRRNTFEVYVDDSLQANGEKTIGDYALIMHEGRGSIWHDLGKKSQLKNASVSARVGEKYLERAADEYRDSIIRAVELFYKKRARR